MQAHVCWYLPAGEFVCEQNLELKPLPKESGATWQATVQAGLGVSIAWRCIVNGSGAYKVTAVRPTEDGMIEATLAKAKGS